MTAVYLPPWRIDVSARPGVRPPVSRTSLARLAAHALNVARAPSPGSLALILASDRELAALNEKHLGHEGPTDVLSFPLLTAGFALPPGKRPHLGDIVVSIERARAQAAGSVEDELRQLVVHGVLHICGWDHAVADERDAMRALESAILREQ